MPTENTPPSFIHLHLNTNYSFNHGLVESRAAANLCKGQGMTACACTDHGTLGVAMRFKIEMESQGIKPIYGCEFQVGKAEENWEDTSNVPNPHRGMTLVCLAETLEGYWNLCRLASGTAMGDLRFEMKEQYISKELLRKHHQGLIALSGGPTGEVARKCRDGEQAVDEAIAEYLDIFGKGNFFLEMQDHGLPEEQAINQALLNASKRTGVPVVATNDVHYLTREQAHAHEVLLCIGRRTAMANPRHPVLPGGPEYYLKSPAEMEQLFAWCPEALQNTVAIAERCKVVIPTTETDSSLTHKPLFQLPADFQGTHDDYLREVCKAGLRRRYGIDADASSHTDEEQRVLDRMYRELDFIISTSLSNEFLVIWDLLWDSSKDAWRWYNIGRGAVCGSLVAYLMPIHDVDPLKYNLLFERFLNEERIPCFSFDIDEGHICKDVVFQEAQKRYGAQNVARRLEIEPVKSDKIVILVGKALGGRFEDYGRIVDIVRKYWMVKYALEGNKKLQRLVKSKAWAKEIVETSIALERIILETSSGNSGIIIGDTPLPDVCAVGTAAGYCELVSFLDYFNVQKLGMLEIGRWRMDRFAEETLRNSGGSFQTIPDDIPEALALLAKDDDRFYCENLSDELLTGEAATALRRLNATEYDSLGHFLPDARPRNIEELAASYAIYRPGPIEFLGDYLRRRSGEAPVVYEAPELEPVLKETYGIILYQEQFMQIINVISGLSLGKADCIRRCLGTRKNQQMERWHGIFFEEARKRGFSDGCIARIWEKLQYHSLYCYQKAHAVARAILLYRVAYVKAGLAQG